MVKVERTLPAPASLLTESRKENGNYALTDVVQQLRQDFHDKCYVCEMKNLQDPQIEHLLPHKNGKDKEREFDWKNLLWSCGHCNSVKNQKKYEGRILDCCEVDPEKVLSFNIEMNDVKVLVKNSNDEKAIKTARLVEEVFNLKNTGMRVYKSELRFALLQTEMNVLYINLNKFKENKNSVLTLRTLRGLLSRESAFAGFKRCYVREHAKDYPELLEFLK